MKTKALSRHSSAPNASEHSLQSRSEQIVSLIPAYIFETDLAGKPTWVNQRVLELFGLTPEEATTFNYAEHVHPDDLIRLQQKLISGADEQGVITFELRIKRGDNSYSQFLGTCVRRLDGDKKPNGYLGTFLDITKERDCELRLEPARGLKRANNEAEIAENQLRHQKELLQRIFDHVPVAINFVDANGGIEMVNPAWQRMMGLSLDEVREKQLDVFENFYPDPDYRREVKTFAETSNGQWKDFKVTMRDGRVVDMTWAVAHLSDGGFIGIGQDISERKHAEEALQTFSRRLIAAQEAERQRIARELHDEIGQVLTAVRLNLQSIETSCETPGCIPFVNENMVAVDEAIRLVRDLSFDLRPSLLDDLGLIAAVRWYVERYEKRSGLVIKVTVDSFEAEKRLPREIETAAFRIIQEALTNVVRHAQAKRVFVELKQDVDGLILSIKDDGKGFDVQSIVNGSALIVSLGLRGMEERAIALGGRMKIVSTPGKGTEVNSYLPTANFKRLAAN